MNWPEEFFYEKLFKRTFFCPIGYKDKDEWVPEIIGIVPGDSIMVLHMIKSKEMTVISVSRKNLLDAVIDCLNSLDCKNSAFGFISTCDGRLETLGAKVFNVKDEITKHFGDRPFLALYCGGEAIKKPNEHFKYGNVTFNAAIFKNK